MKGQKKLSRNTRTDAKKIKRAGQHNQTELNRARKMRNRFRANPKDRQLLEAMLARKISP